MKKQIKNLLFTFCGIILLSVNSFAQKQHSKVINEKVTNKNMMDRKTHPNSDIVDFKFADGTSAHMVKRNGNWYGYNIRGESKETMFASKEAGLQKIWTDAVSAEKVGGAAAATIIKNKKAKNADAFYDYQNGGQKVIMRNGKKIPVN